MGLARRAREEEGDVGAHPRQGATKRSSATPMRPLGSGDARASASLALLDDVTTSPASRRLASAPAAPGTRLLLILGQAPRDGPFPEGSWFDSRWPILVVAT